MLIWQRYWLSVSCVWNVLLLSFGFRMFYNFKFRFSFRSTFLYDSFDCLRVFTWGFVYTCVNEKLRKPVETKHCLHLNFLVTCEVTHKLNESCLKVFGGEEVIKVSCGWSSGKLNYLLIVYATNDASRVLQDLSHFMRYLYSENIKTLSQNITMLRVIKIAGALEKSIQCFAKRLILKIWRKNKTNDNIKTSHTSSKLPV